MLTAKTTMSPAAVDAMVKRIETEMNIAAEENRLAFRAYMDADYTMMGEEECANREMRYVLSQGRFAAWNHALELIREYTAR